MPIRTFRSPDPVTRATRRAANAAAVAVVAWTVLFAVTTQLAGVRAASPFADDPWDAVASFAAIALVVVVAATGVRSLRHRGPVLPIATAARIRLGAGCALAIVAVNVLSDALALAVVPLPEPGAAGDGRLALLVVLIGITAAATVVAGVLVIRAGMVAAETPPRPNASVGFAEPDILDDALGLTDEVLDHVPVVSRPGRRLVASVAGTLDGATLSPRRHRIVFGVVASLVAGAAFAAWHAFREGAWASPVAALVFASLVAIGVLAAYLVTLRPLRLIRSI